MIWLSSFPRSGNTFTRNILYEVYGLESSSYFEGVGNPDNYTSFPFVKTHHLPCNIPPIESNTPCIYLIRDGRDALVSLAHHRKDIHEPQSVLEKNLREAILAAEGSYFGGWSHNVNEWSKQANIIIYFEELITSPLQQIERIREIYDLPPAKKDNLPTFISQKHGFPRYGRGSRVTKNIDRQKEIIRKSFRRGKVGGWKDEMSEELHDLFWSYHRSTMMKFGYQYDGQHHQNLHPDFDYDIIGKLGKSIHQQKAYRILIEANKLLLQNDGIKRYLSELLQALHPVTLNPKSRWHIDLYIDGKIVPLCEYGDSLYDDNENSDNTTPKTLSLYERMLDYTKNILRPFLSQTSQDRLFAIYQKLESIVKKFLQHQNPTATVTQLENYDLIHVPLPQNYQFVEKIKARFMVTIHDLTHTLFPEYHVERNIWLANMGFQFFKDNASGFIAISHHTKKDLQNIYNIQESIPVIYQAANNNKFKPLFNQHHSNLVRSHYNIPQGKDYLLTLCTAEPRKNLDNTVKAFSNLLDENPQLDIYLVVAGGKGWKWQERQIKHKNRVIYTGFVEENHLPVLYNSAIALVYISFYEGFGLPLLEAMCCATPIIFANNSSMRELFSSYGLGVTAHDVSEIKTQMYNIVVDKDLRKTLSRKALKRSFDFSWRTTAEKTLEAYAQFIENSTQNEEQ